MTNPTNTVYGIKRFVGHAFDDQAVQEDTKNAPFSISKAESGGVSAKLGEKEYSPEEISAMILRKLKDDAEMRLGGQHKKKAVNHCACIFSMMHKEKANKRCRKKIAGLEVKKNLSTSQTAAGHWHYGF